MYLGECRELGIPILPPDINTSQLAFTVEQDGRPLRPRARSRTSARARSCRCSASRKELGRDRFAVHAVRAGRPAAREQAAARKPGQGRRVRLARADGHDPRRGARGCSRRSTGRSSTAAGTSATATRGRTQLFGGGDDGDEPGGRFRCPMRRRGPRRSSSRSRRSARPLHERPSARALQRGAEGVRRAARRRSHAARSPTSGSAASSAACAR